jgi:hypothetical protein
MRMARGFTAYAVIVAAGLAGAPVCAEEAAPAQSFALDNPQAAHPLAELAATRDRPLFTPSRRPPAPPVVARVAAPPPPPPSPPDIALYGTLVDRDGASAIVRKGSEKPIHVRVGDQVDGWAVTEIGERQIVLALDERSATFAMFNGGHAGAPGAVVNFRLPTPVVATNAQGRRVRP